jgi:hypothetical protein
LATLDTVLEKFSGLLSKDFVANGIPVLAFATLHTAAAYRVFPATRRWIQASYLSDPAHNIAAGFVTLLFLIVLTYVLSPLNTPLRELLEGKTWPALLTSIFRQKYRARLAALEKQEQTARRARRALRLGTPAWNAKLAEAAAVGKKTGVCTYVGCPSLNRMIFRLAWDRGTSAEEIDSAVVALANELSANSNALKGTDNQLTPAARRLDDDHGKLLKAIDSAREHWEVLWVQHSNQIQSDFPGRRVAPTRMGNIAAVAAHYASSRYSLNLEIFWTRLQNVIQTNDAFYGLLQDGKRQLDFPIALFWQTAFFTAVWSLIIALVGGRPYLFLAITVSGVAGMRIWYSVALNSYKSFSDLVRAAVDLYRLALLKALHIPPPVNAEQERLIWESLETRLGYGARENVALQTG